MTRKLKTKKLSLCLIFGLLLSWSISCRSVTSTSNSPEIKFWTMQLKPQFNQYFSELNRDFEKENQNVKVSWVDIPWSAMESKILTAVSAKTAPDVVNLNPGFASQLATRNAWMDLNEKISPEIKKQYLPKIWQASTIENKSFGIPWYLTTRVTIYNQDLLTKAGVDKPPANYEELAKVARQVREKTGKYAFFITFVPEDSAEALESMVQMGVKLVDDKGKAAFNTPEGVAAFRYWVDLYQQQLLPEEVLTQGHRQAIELYQSGETALLASGAEFLKTISTNAPDVAKVSATAPQITGKTGKKNVAVMNLVIPRDTSKPDEALKYALYVTNTQNQLAFAKAANVLPSTTEAVEEYVKELEKSSQTNSIEAARKVSATQLKDAEVLIPAMSNIKQLQKIIYENLQASMLKEKTVEQAVKDAEMEWNKTTEIKN
jgi:putative chitobiose transport system substrate-binding protein